MKAVVLGATGLVGEQVLQLLAEHGAVTSVVAITRRDVTMPNSKCTNIVASLDDLSSVKDLFNGAVVFCCLGTTMRRAGSKAAFRRVDYDYCVEAARIAKVQNSEKFLMISAANADQKSFSFYARVKGEAEQAVANLALPSTIFLRPSLLLGEREERRVGEDIGQGVTRLLMPVLNKLKAPWVPISSDTVAKAMVCSAFNDSLSGVHYLYYSDLVNAAQSLN